MKKKTVALLLALVLVFGVAAGGTLAWLTAQTSEVKNTFTYGDINIELTETTSGYKVVPGATDSKDPTIKVTAGSEKCYVYAKVENTVKMDGTVVATPNINAGNWILVGEKDDVKLYRYKTVVDAAKAEAQLSVFTEVSYADTITKDKIAAVAGGQITITAYAHQSEYTNQGTADAAAIDWAGVTAVTPTT